jgi:hypothetical protein
VIAVVGALVDVDAAGHQPIIEALQVGDAGADFLLGPGGALEIIERDFRGSPH